jgi:hypothetical protein
MGAAANSHQFHRRAACRGAVLLLALVFMLMMALVATTVMQTAILQLRMSGNAQFLEEALHTAQAIASELSLQPENFSLEHDIGRGNCPANASVADCQSYQLLAPVSAVAPAGVQLDYRVTRQEPLFWHGFPIREAEHLASSSRSFNAATFEISVRIDGSRNRLGSAHIVQGIALRVPAVH